MIFHTIILGDGNKLQVPTSTPPDLYKFIQQNKELKDFKNKIKSIKNENI